MGRCLVLETDRSELILTIKDIKLNPAFEQRQTDTALNGIYCSYLMPVRDVPDKIDQLCFCFKIFSCPLTSREGMV